MFKTSDASPPDNFSHTSLHLHDLAELLDIPQDQGQEGQEDIHHAHQEHRDHSGQLKRKSLFLRKNNARFSGKSADLFRNLNIQRLTNVSLKDSVS